MISTMKVLTLLLVFIPLISYSSCLPNVLKNPLIQLQKYCGISKQQPRWLFGKLLACHTDPPELADATLGDKIIYDDPKIPRVTVTCNPGYVFPDLTPVRDMTFEGGKWRIQDSCQAKKCDAEARLNTVLTNSSLPGLDNGITLTVGCSDGYLTSDATTLYESTCEFGVWSHTDDCIYEVANVCPETTVYNTEQPGDVIPLSVQGTTLTVTCAGEETLQDDSTTIYYTTCTAEEWNDTRSCGIKSCQDALDDGFPSGVYKIYPDTALTEMEVYCEFNYTDNEAWTVVQLRTSDAVDFNRNWTEYENGFGDWDLGNYWTGLINLNILTTDPSKVCRLTVEVANPCGAIAYAFYDEWGIGDVDSDYELINAHGFKKGTPFNAGPGFHGHTGSKFSTPEDDRDNDNKAGIHCAQKFGSGWWWNDCGQSNLNGPYTTGEPALAWGGISWRNRINATESAPMVRMMLKCPLRSGS